jgi:hypothetical protein
MRDDYDVRLAQLNVITRCDRLGQRALAANGRSFRGRPVRVARFARCEANRRRGQLALKTRSRGRCLGLLFADCPSDACRVDRAMASNDFRRN